MNKACPLPRRVFPLLMLLTCLGQGFGAVIEPAQLLFWTAPFGDIPTGRTGGLAFDGSNYLCTVQSDAGQLSAQRLNISGGLLGEPIALDRIGTPPVIAFDGNNYLLVWAETNHSPSVPFGQFIDTQGTKIGEPFPMSGDSDVSDVGGLAFDGMNYFVVWESKAGSDFGAKVQGQFISPAGDRLGDTLSISDGTNNNRFPVVAFDGSRHLLGWLAQSTEAGTWDVTGRLLGNDGVLSAPFIISQTVLSNASPISVAAGNTNFLVAWSRQTGPFPLEAPGEPTNLWLPMIYGRLVSAPATFTGDEFQISLAQGGQVMPAIAFNGRNFLVAWEDDRLRTSSVYVYFICPNCPRIDRWNFFAQLVDPTGKLVESAFRVFTWRDDFTTPDSSVLVYLDGQFRLLRNSDASSSNARGAILAPDPISSLRNNHLTSTGDFQTELLGVPRRGYTFEFSNDLIHWNLVWNPVLYGVVLQRQVDVVIPAGILPQTNRIFFRASDGWPECVGNLRRIQAAKQSWALEEDRTLVNLPSDGDLFGPGRFLPVKPVCPNGGTYSPNTLGTYATCSFGPIASHTL